MPGTGKRTGIAAWVEWTISQKATVHVMVFLLSLLGVVGVSRMNKDEFPTFEIKQGLVVGIYPGATAAEVETRLAVPLEETLFSFREIIRSTVRTVCRDGVCYIYADLNAPQAKKDEIWSKIKLKLQDRRLTLPAGVLAVAVLDDFSALSSVMLALQSTDKGYAELEEISDRLRDALRGVDMLSGIRVIGARKEEIAVTVDKDRLSAYGINPGTLLLGYQTASLPALDGMFDAGYVSAPVHVSPTLSGEQEVEEKIVYVDPAGNAVRLRDVARIERRYQPPTEEVCHNGNPCLVLSLEMRPENDITAFGREVDRVLEAFRAELPPSVTLTKITDQPKVVGDAVFSFLRDLLVSMLVVVAVMLLLFPLRSALIASSGLPLITAMTLCVMYVTGIDLNTVTLAALITCLGMIVDDSIITMDGYMDKLRRGLSRVDAACASARELFLPTLVATLAIALMFFPVKVILSGYLRDFVRFFPWVILVALLLSLVYAVSMVPSLETKFISSSTRDEEHVFSRLQAVLFGALEGGYAKAQAWCFRHAGFTLLLAVVAVALGVVLFSRLNFQMVPKAARDFFSVEVELEGGSDRDDTREVVDSLSKMLLRDGRIVSVTSFLGASVPRFSATYAPKLPFPTAAQLIVKTRSAAATASFLEREECRYEHIFPSALIRFKQMDYQMVEAPVMVSFKGENREAFYPAADAVRAFLMRKLADKVKWVHAENDDQHPVIAVSMDADESSRMGVSRSVLALQLSAAFNGQQVTSLWERGREIPVTLYGEDIAKGMPYSTVDDQRLASAFPGVSVPLRQVATVAPEVSVTQLERLGGEPSVTVYADLQYGKSHPAVMGKVRRFVSGLLLPEGTTVEYGGLSAMNRVLGPEIAIAFFVACLVLFFFLLFHFRKASIALLTMGMSTLCFFGAFLGLWVFGLDFGMTAALGLISLVGIVVRNGILMYEYAEEKRSRDGHDVRTAAMEAGQRRVRPIFLTSCTTALGVLPMILSGDILWLPMGVIICFGTLLSIVLIVLAMPVGYYLVFRRRARTGAGGGAA